MEQVNGIDIALIRRAKAGDRTALKVLLAQSHVALRARIASRVPNDLQAVIDADDVIQETYIRVLRSMADLQNEQRCGFERWLSAIALNRLRTEIKKHRALKRGGETSRRALNPYDASSLNLLDAIAASDGTPSRIASVGEAVTEVKAALALLPQHYANAIQCIYMEGRSVKETADRMDRTERAVHGLCRRGISQLRVHLEKKSLLYTWT